MNYLKSKINMKKAILGFVLLASCTTAPCEQSSIIADTIVSADTVVVADTISADTAKVDSIVAPK